MSELTHEQPFLDALTRSPADSLAYDAALGALLAARLVGRTSDGDPGAAHVRDALRRHAASAMLDREGAVLLRAIAWNAALSEGRLGETALRAAMVFARWLRESGLVRVAYALLKTIVAHWPEDVAPRLRFECAFRMMMLELRGAGEPADGRRLGVLLERYAQEAKHPEGRLLSLQLAAEHEVRVGNIPEAAAVATALIAEAQRLGGANRLQLGHLYAAVAAGRGGNPSLAASHAAQVISLGQSIRTIAMLDAAMILGDALVDLGFPEAARHCYEPVASVTPDAVQRAIALLGILTTTARIGTEQEFQAIRARIDAEDVLTVVRVDAMISVARGLRRFGHVDEAMATLREARALAEKYNLHQDWFSIDKAMAEAQEAPAPSGRPLTRELASAVSWLEASHREREAGVA